MENGGCFEAVQPVGRCRLKDWARRGKENVFVVKRLKQDAVLTKHVLDSMRSIAGTWFRRDYDPFFEWSDDRLYCSELIWKLYERTTGLQLESCSNCSLGSFGSASAGNYVRAL